MPSSVRDFSSPSARQKWLGQILKLTDSKADELRWLALAKELFAAQYEAIPVYRSLCNAYKVNPGNLESIEQIPAAPQQLFKQHTLYAHERSPGVVYETSGSTTGVPGRQNLLSADIYQGVSVAGASVVALDPPKTVRRLHFLASSPAEAPTSSLSAMFQFWAQAHPSKESPRFWVLGNKLQAWELRQALLEDAEQGRSVGVAGTAFHFLHLLDSWATVPKKPKLQLPKGSWVLETGGFKGRSREIPKHELYTQLSRAFMLKTNFIWNEYGMSELSSQAYAHGIDGLHTTPPWAKVLIIDPATNLPVRPGKTGLVRWLDLANVDSLMALQTLDVAVASRNPSSFQLIGRLPSTEPRGCSLTADELLPHSR